MALAVAQGTTPERSPGSASAGAQRGLLHPGSAHQGRWERLWLALATGMGFTLPEAAQFAHGAGKALQRARRAVGAVRADLRERAARAAWALFSALLRVYGWQLMPEAGPCWYKAARLDGAHWLHSDGPWWRVLRQARRFPLTPRQAQALAHGHSQRLAQAEAEADAANRRAFQRREALTRLCARLRFYREALHTEWERRVRAERALEQSQALLASEGHERDFATMEAGEASRRALEAETRLGTVGAQLEEMGGELEEMRAALEGLREEVSDTARRSSTWKALFVRALALAAQAHATAEENRRKHEHEAGRAASFWKRYRKVAENAQRNRRIQRRLLRSERRHAAGLRQACRAALEQLEDVHGGWTVHGVSVRQGLRRVLGKPLVPVCPTCGVDWWKPVLKGDGKPCGPCRVSLGEDSGTAPRAAAAEAPTPRPRRLRRASGRPVSLGCLVCGEEGCVREHEGAAP